MKWRLKSFNIKQKFVIEHFSFTVQNSITVIIKIWNRKEKKKKWMQCKTKTKRFAKKNFFFSFQCNNISNYTILYLAIEGKNYFTIFFLSYLNCKFPKKKIKIFFKFMNGKLKWVSTIAAFNFQIWKKKKIIEKFFSFLYSFFFFNCWILNYFMVYYSKEYIYICMFECLAKKYYIFWNIFFFFCFSLLFEC